MNRPPRVQQLMDRLREQEFSREQVAAVWHKAVWRIWWRTRWKYAVFARARCTIQS